MPGNSAVKSTARVALKSFWPQAIAVCAILIAAFLIAVYMCSVNELVLSKFAPLVNIPLFTMLFVAVLTPLCLGIFRFFYKATAGNIDRIDTVFYFFIGGRYLKSVFFSLMFFVKLLTVAVITYLPYMLVRTAIGLELEIFPDSFLFYAQMISLVLSIIGTILFVLATSKYYIAPMVYACRDDMNWTEVFYIAKHISRHSAGAFLILLIGFLGWALLSLFGIPILFLLPYFITAYAIHCRYAFYHYNRKLDSSKDTEFPKYRSSF